MLFNKIYGNKLFIDFIQSSYYKRNELLNVELYF